MTWLRLKAGCYESADGRILITRAKSQCTGHADEVCWAVEIDGKEVPRAYNTLAEAKSQAEKRLAKVPFPPSTSAVHDDIGIDP